jgi:glycosyltransferase involved in cell wall biosynthesis
MGSGEQSTAGEKSGAEVSAKVEQLQGEVRQLEEDVRRLHEQLSLVYDRMQNGATTGGLDIGDLELAPPTPKGPILGRAARKVARASARVVRGVLKSLSPSHVPLHTLRLADEPEALDSLPTIGLGDDHDVVIDGAAPVAGRLQDLQRLFALESIDAAVLGETVIRRRGLPPQACRDDRELARTAAASGRAVIVKDLDRRPGSDPELELQPSGLSGGEKVWHGGPYRVALPKDRRRAELRLRRHLPPGDGETRGSVELLVIVDEPLVNGLELRVGAVVAAAADRGLAPVLLSLAPPGQPGGRRLDAVDRLACRTMAPGATVHPAAHEAVIRSLCESGGPQLVWAIGDGPRLLRMIRICTEARPGLRVLWEPLGIPAAVPPEVGTLLARREGRYDQLSAAFPDTECVLAPTPVATSERKPPADESARDDPQMRTVLFAGDLCAESRPEDAVAAARQLRDHESVRVLMAGDGSMRSTVADLARMFQLENFGLVTAEAELEALVAGADVLCVNHESPFLTPAAAAALAWGTPIVAVDVPSELRDLARAVQHPLEIAGAPGDTGSFVRGILAALGRPRAPTCGSAIDAQTAAARAALSALLRP